MSAYPYIPGGLVQPHELQEGAVYVYMGELPEWAKGQQYRFHRFVVDVPSYQMKVLVESLTAKDKGQWFVCSVANFCIRYQPL